jgi:hypothetical protein
LVVVGGVAAVLNGAPVATFNLDGAMRTCCPTPSRFASVVSRFGCSDYRL